MISVANISTEWRVSRTTNVSSWAKQVQLLNSVGWFPYQDSYTLRWTLRYML